MIAGRYRESKGGGFNGMVLDDIKRAFSPPNQGSARKEAPRAYEDRTKGNVINYQEI